MKNLEQKVSGFSLIVKDNFQYWVVAYTPVGAMVGRVWCIIFDSAKDKIMNVINENQIVVKLKDHRIYLTLSYYCGDDSICEYDLSDLASQMLSFFRDQYLTKSKGRQMLRKTAEKLS